MSQARLAVDDLTVRYIGRRTAALKHLSLRVGAGEVLAVAGRNGAGKSTLALAAAGFIPRVVRARVEGRVVVDAVSALDATLPELAGRVGICFSSPALQLSSSKPTVREELAFGLENLAVPHAEMEARIAETLGRLNILHLADREPLALSGGEQQRVAIASILVMGTQLLVLDEPTAQLDPGGTVDMASLLGELAAAGRTVLVAEHAPEVLAAGDECLVLNDGQAVIKAAPGRALAGSGLRGSGLHSPTLVALAEAAGLPPEQAFDEEAIARALDHARTSAKPATIERPMAGPLPDVPAVRGATVEQIEVDDVAHVYAGGVEALRGVDLTVGAGETLAIVGQNGSGKTTLVKHLNGLLRPERGSVLIGGADLRHRRTSDIAAQVGFVFQSPDDQLFHSRVEQEVGFGPRNLRLAPEQVATLVDNALALTGLEEERATNPYDLGISMRKLVSLASVLAMEPPILVLDEPTTGQDGAGVERIGAIIDAWARAGRTVIAITHNMEFAARHFGRIVVMRRAEVVADDVPSRIFDGANAELLASTGLRQPPAARIAARLGLSGAPADAEGLLSALRASVLGGG